MEDVRECPHCGEPTVPNRRADGSVVCSCAAARPLGPDQSGMIAVASISTRAAGSASAMTPTSAIAGKLRPITSR